MGLMRRCIRKMYWIINKYISDLNKIYIDEVSSIRLFPSEGDLIRIEHVAMYTTGNAGDILLPRTVRDAFSIFSSSIDWQGCHAHRVVDKAIVSEINKKNGLLVGGGGLFLCDTNPNGLSGWQWSCGVPELKQINVPIALFAVGYNRFRGQPDFLPVFKEHLRLLAEKCIYISLRNHGSLNAIKQYLPEPLHAKLRYQPCPTTICSKLYPELICEYKKKTKINTIALNCAFDRIGKRLGEEKDKVLYALALVMKRCVSNGFEVEYFAHGKSDEFMLAYLDRAGVPYRLVKLYDIHPREVLRAYSQVGLSVGMRGHSQMIPFGCGTPILSLISHDKLKWFLDDIGQPQWGVEMLDSNFSENLYGRIVTSFNQKDVRESEIEHIKNKLYEITEINVADFLSVVKAS